MGEAQTKKLNEASRQKSALEIMGEHERAKQRAKAERRAAKEAKVAARLEREEFERTGGQVKMSKKERKRMETLKSLCRFLDPSNGSSWTSSLYFIGSWLSRSRSVARC